MLLLLFLSQAGVQKIWRVHWLWRVLMGEYAFATVGHATFRADTYWLLATATGTDFRTQSASAFPSTVSYCAERYLPEAF